MLERIETRTIIMNGLKNTKSSIQGKLIKIVLDVDTNFPDLEIAFYSDVGEPLLSIIGVQEGKTIYYPLNELEENFKDYFYLLGPVFMKIDNLPEGSAIKNIIIYYDN